MTSNASLSQRSSRSLSSLFLAKYKPCLEIFNLELDNNRTIYLPGQRIEGHVSVGFNELTKVKLIRVRVSGSIITQVYKNSSASGNQLSSMVLFKDYVNLGGTGNIEGGLIELGHGESVFPFSFRLPLSALPASFTGAYGRVKYEISAVLIAPGLSKQIKTIPITIPSTIPNTNDSFSNPVVSESVLPIKNFFYWEVSLLFLIARLDMLILNAQFLNVDLILKKLFLSRWKLLITLNLQFPYIMFV